MPDTAKSERAWAAAALVAILVAVAAILKFNPSEDALLWIMIASMSLPPAWSFVRWSFFRSEFLLKTR